MPASALVIGASGGIGSAMADTLRARGVVVVTLSRRDDGLDVTDADAVARIMGAVDGPFDLVLVAVGVLGTPEKSLEAVDAAAMARIMAVNAIGPALILRHAARLLPRKGRSVCAVLSARVGSIGDNRIGGWYGYRASKAALNQIIHGAAIELGRSHKDSIVVALHPGTVETPFTAAYAGHHKTVTAQVAAGNLIGVIDGLTRDATGGFFDYAGQVVPW
ncbi:SDR family NAD(P)-dependent oxidoreductase [Loktanella sp. DJP18]|uniref:SDR family NAD(P)-dependent oxidoreductase n=1 Tax=Loktanella sp. DJP18 TaxID=3409788 RepID=UPI003BB60C42